MKNIRRNSSTRSRNNANQSSNGPNSLANIENLCLCTGAPETVVVEGPPGPQGETVPWSSGPQGDQDPGTGREIYYATYIRGNSQRYRPNDFAIRPNINRTGNFAQREQYRCFLEEGNVFGYRLAFISPVSTAEDRFCCFMLTACLIKGYLIRF